MITTSFRYNGNRKYQLTLYKKHLMKISVVSSRLIGIWQGKSFTTATPNELQFQFDLEDKK
jgi:hypothetical protein